MTTTVIGFVICVIAALIVGLVTLQFVNFREWLVWACTQAESFYGSGTGQLKLQYAYDYATDKFPVLTKFITFNTFKKWVDIALIKMRDFIENNEKIAEIVTKVDEVI